MPSGKFGQSTSQSLPFPSVPPIIRLGRYGLRFFAYIVSASNACTSGHIELSPSKLGGFVNLVTEADLFPNDRDAFHTYEYHFVCSARPGAHHKVALLHKAPPQRISLMPADCSNILLAVLLASSESAFHKPHLAVPTNGHDPVLRPAPKSAYRITRLLRK